MMREKKEIVVYPSETDRIISDLQVQVRELQIVVAVLSTHTPVLSHQEQAVVNQIIDRLRA